MDHPVGEAQPYAAALAEAGHDATCHPETRQAAHRPDQRIAIGCESERAIDDLLDAGVLKRREMPETHFQRRRDTVDVRLKQFVAEIPGRRLLGPWLSCLFVGAHQHAAALLAQIEFAVKINRMDDFRAGFPVPGGDLRHVLGNEVHVLHGEDRQLQPDHAAHLARPQAARIDDVFGNDLALVRDDPPHAIGAANDIHDLGESLDFRPQRAR